MRRFILFTIIIITIFINTEKILPQSSDKDDKQTKEDDENIYIMSNMGRISVNLPQGWNADKKNNQQHIIYLDDKVNILVDKSNNNTLIDALYDIPEIFKTKIEILNTTEIDTGNYRGIIAESYIKLSGLNSLISVMDINSTLVVFFGYCNSGYYDTLVKGFKEIIFSIKPNSKKSGYIILDKLGDYQIKLESGWSVNFEDKKYIFTKDNEFAIIMVTFSEYKDLGLSLDSFKYKFDFSELTFFGKEIIYNNGYEGVLAEGTGVFKDIKVGIIGEVIKFEYDTIMISGIVDYKSYYNNFYLNKEILKIISSINEL